MDKPLRNTAIPVTIFAWHNYYLNDGYIVLTVVSPINQHQKLLNYKIFPWYLYIYLLNCVLTKTLVVWSRFPRRVLSVGDFQRDLSSGPVHPHHFCSLRSDEGRTLYPCRLLHRMLNGRSAAARGTLFRSKAVYRGDLGQSDISSSTLQKRSCSVFGRCLQMCQRYGKLIIMLRLQSIQR